MPFSIRATILIIGILFSQLMSACVPQTSAPQTPETTALARVTIPETEIRQIESSKTGRSYDIYVRLPSGYEQNQKKYPILYVLDGQWDFKLLDSIYGGLVYDGFVPEMIIIGITYSGDDPDYGSLRTMDYTPMHDLFFPGSGDGPKFFAFFKEELIPFVESTYRVDPSQRALMGGSFGGTFTLYAMFTEPTLFSGYVAASPIVVFGNKDVFRQEAAYASSHPDLPVRLFLSVGELEDMRQPVEEFMQVLNERNYTGLEMMTRTIEGEEHAGNKPEAYNRGLRFIFQDE
ncbi:MAG TPA: alpha/beta hydrolase-fold protein [Anaerolineales bacterium]|nr:alpha/beta hydrolase-fold protein [Anaerolineales bacterium]